MRHLALIHSDDDPLGSSRRRPEPADAATLAALVARARAGDRWAEEALVRTLSHGALRLATRLLRHHADAEDVVQEALVDFLDGLSRLRDDARAAAYLRGAVVHRAHRRLRRRALLRRLGFVRPLDDAPLEAALVDTADPEALALARAVDRVLAELPEAERVALVLHGLEGHTLDEVAELTGASLATVKRRVAAARARLQPHLPHTPEEPRHG